MTCGGQAVRRRNAGAPVGVSPVELLLALPSLSHVVSVVLLTDPLGYGKLDAPLIDLRIGRTLNDLQPAGTWAVLSNTSLVH